MSMHRTVAGRVRYTSMKPGMQGAERGREWFAFTHHADGSVIMRARCEIEEPSPALLRDVIYHIGPGMVPLHLHVHLTLGEAFLGSGWLRHDPQAGIVECESFGPSIGRVSERRADAGAIDGFGTHPVVGDAFLSRVMDASRGPHRRALRVILPSPDHRGATPPRIAVHRIALEYVAREERQVAAGTFACRHFRFIDDLGEGMGGTTHPDYDIWVTDDEDAVLVFAEVGGAMMNRYELIELER